MLPRKKRETTTATTAEMTIGVNSETAKPPMMTSPAKSAPAMGALKVAEMPAAAPQPTRVRIWAVLSFSSCPTDEPNAEPIWTIGPSRPTEPPVPMESAEASALAATIRARMMPPRSATAFITSGTPCPRASRAKK